jgi:hypothetical protein
VGDQHHGRAVGGGRPQQRLDHRVGTRPVEAAGRLVRQHDAGTGVEGAGDGHPQPLAARERPGPRAGARRQAHGVEQGAAPFDVDAAADPAGQRHVLQGGEVGEEVVLLEHQADPPGAGTGGALGGERVDREVAPPDLARGRSIERGQQVQQRALAGARRALDRPGLSRGDL